MFRILLRTGNGFILLKYSTDHRKRDYDFRLSAHLRFEHAAIIIVDTREIKFMTENKIIVLKFVSHPQQNDTRMTIKLNEMSN